MFKEKVIQMSDLKYIELKIAFVIFFFTFTCKKKVNKDDKIQK